MTWLNGIPPECPWYSVGSGFSSSYALGSLASRGNIVRDPEKVVLVLGIRTLCVRTSILSSCPTAIERDGFDRDGEDACDIGR